MALEKVKSKVLQYKDSVADTIYSIKHRKKEDVYAPEHFTKQVSNPNPALRAKNGLKEKFWFWKHLRRDHGDELLKKAEEGSLEASGEAKLHQHRLAYWAAKTKAIISGRV